jgi:hypothetical protein
MRQSESDDVMRVYGGFSRALHTVADIGALVPVNGSDAKIAAGVSVYRNNVRAAYLRALEDSFPVVARLVGEDFFRYLAHEYFHANPPRSRLVARYGDHLPAFLGSFEPAASLPYLADVGRLEVAWLRAHHAAEATPLRPDELFDRIGEDPYRARLTLHPSMSLLTSRHPVYAIWLHNHERREGKLQLSSTGERVLIARPEAEVVVTPLSAEVWRALDRLAAGDTLGEAIETALNENAAASPAEILQYILSYNVIIAADVDQERRA